MVVTALWHRRNGGGEWSGGGHSLRRSSAYQGRGCKPGYETLFVASCVDWRSRSTRVCVLGFWLVTAPAAGGEDGAHADEELCAAASLVCVLNDRISVCSLRIPSAFRCATSPVCETTGRKRCRPPNTFTEDDSGSSFLRHLPP